jgi:hypothetical protein
LLRSAKVQKLIAARLKRAIEEVYGVTPRTSHRPPLTARAPPDTEMVDVFDFVTLISPAKAVEGVKAAGKPDEAKAVLKMAGMGFYIDLEKAKEAGLGRFAREISHDAETGAPKLKLLDNLAMLELSQPGDA